MKNDMTKGNPMRLILLFSVPLLIGNVFQQFYNMADTVIVGRTIGIGALAAVGATSSISFLIVNFAIGMTSGFAVVTAQRFGAKDEKGLRASVATSIILSVSIAVIIALISTLISHSLLVFMQTPDDIINDSYNYIIVIFAGIAAPVFFNLFSSILRSLGDSKTPLIFLIAASVLNIVLDFVFILGFSLGVAGAAWATVISQFISGAVCALYSFKRFPILKLKKEDWKFSWRFAWIHLRIALPMAFQFSVTAIGVMLIQTALNTLGSTVVASYTAASKIDQLVTQPLVSFGIAMASYSAQNYGAEKIDRIREGVKSCIIASVIAGIAGGVIAITCCRPLVYLFVGNTQGEVLGYVQKYIMIKSSAYISLGTLFVFRNVLQGVGISSIPFIAGVLELIVRALVAFLFVDKLQFTAICISSPLAWIAANIPLVIMYIIFIKKYKKGLKLHSFLKYIQKGSKI